MVWWLLLILLLGSSDAVVYTGGNATLAGILSDAGVVDPSLEDLVLQSSNTPYTVLVDAIASLASVRVETGASLDLSLGLTLSVSANTTVLGTLVTASGGLVTNSLYLQPDSTLECIVTVSPPGGPPPLFVQGAPTLLEGADLVMSANLANNSAFLGRGVRAPVIAHAGGYTGEFRTVRSSDAAFEYFVYFSEILHSAERYRATPVHGQDEVVIPVPVEPTDVSIPYNEGWILGVGAVGVLIAILLVLLFMFLLSRFDKKPRWMSDNPNRQMDSGAADELLVPPAPTRPTGGGTEQKIVYGTGGVDDGGFGEGQGGMMPENAFDSSSESLTETGAVVPPPPPPPGDAGAEDRYRQRIDQVRTRTLEVAVDDQSSELEDSGISVEATGVDWNQAAAAPAIVHTQLDYEDDQEESWSEEEEDEWTEEEEAWVEAPAARPNEQFMSLRPMGEIQSEYAARPGEVREIPMADNTDTVRLTAAEMGALGAALNANTDDLEEEEWSEEEWEGEEEEWTDEGESQEEEEFIAPAITMSAAERDDVRALVSPREEPVPYSPPTADDVAEDTPFQERTVDIQVEEYEPAPAYDANAPPPSLGAPPPLSYERNTALGRLQAELDAAPPSLDSLDDVQPSAPAAPSLPSSNSAQLRRERTETLDNFVVQQSTGAEPDDYYNPDESFRVTKSLTPLVVERRASTAPQMKPEPLPGSPSFLSQPPPPAPEDVAPSAGYKEEDRLLRTILRKSPRAHQAMLDAPSSPSVDASDGYVEPIAPTERTLAPLSAPKKMAELPPPPSMADPDSVMGAPPPPPGEATLQAPTEKPMTALERARAKVEAARKEREALEASLQN